MQRGARSLDHLAPGPPARRRWAPRLVLTARPSPARIPVHPRVAPQGVVCAARHASGSQVFVVQLRTTTSEPDRPKGCRPTGATRLETSPPVRQPRRAHRQHDGPRTRAPNGREPRTRRPIAAPGRGRSRLREDRSSCLYMSASADALHNFLNSATAEWSVTSSSAIGPCFGRAPRIRPARPQTCSARIPGLGAAWWRHRRRGQRLRRPFRAKLVPLRSQRETPGRRRAGAGKPW